MTPNPPQAIERMLEVLHTCRLSALDDAALRDVLVAAETLRNAAEALQGRSMVEIQRRAHGRDMNDDDVARDTLVLTGAREEFVVDEIAVHLHCTRVAASYRFTTALAAAAYPAVAEAWSRGRLDARKVRIIDDQLIGMAHDPVFVDALADGAANYAAEHTGPQLRAWLCRRLIAAAPAAAEARRERATAGRRVTLTPLPDGVAQLSALMPAVQARQIYDTLTAVAHATDGQDARTLDQRRSDALHDLTTGRALPPRVHLQMTVPASVLVAGSQQPVELAGYGPVTAAQARELIGDACVTAGTVTWQRLLTDPSTGVLTDIGERRYRPSAALERAVRARDLTCRFPGCRRSAVTPRNGVDLDHTTPWPDGATSARNLACLCRHHHRLKHSPDWSVTHQHDGTLTWTTPGGRSFTTRPWQYDDPPDVHAADDS
jgi:hypothetical protein